MRSALTGGQAMRRVGVFAVMVSCALAMAGCGNPVDRMLASDDQRAQLWAQVAARPELSRELVDRLLSADSTRTVLIDRILVSGGARQAVLTRVAQDRTLMDGTIHFAVQDSSMRDHVMTLFRGMQMASGQ
jgi:hypothetical protein